MGWLSRHHCGQALIPLARNQYINNSPGIFTCVHAGADTGTACICTETNSPHIWGILGNQKILVSVKLFVRNSGAGNGCAYFMDTWKKCLLSAGKTHVHKFLLLGGGSADFIFMGARIFLRKASSQFFPVFARVQIQIPACIRAKIIINNVQTRCIVKGEAQKSRFSWGF